MKHTIDEIIKISKENRLDRELRLLKTLEDREKNELRHIKRFIAKMNKSILQAAKAGLYRVEITIEPHLTDTLINGIETYFLAKGYKTNVEQIRHLNRTVVVISWNPYKTPLNNLY